MIVFLSMPVSRIVERIELPSDKSRKTCNLFFPAKYVRHWIRLTSATNPVQLELLRPQLGGNVWLYFARRSLLAAAGFSFRLTYYIHNKYGSQSGIRLDSPFFVDIICRHGHRTSTESAGRPAQRRHKNPAYGSRETGDLGSGRRARRKADNLVPRNAATRNEANESEEISGGRGNRTLPASRSLRRVINPLQRQTAGRPPF